MWHLVLQKNVTISSVQVSIANVLQVSVAPPDPIRDVIHGQSIRPAQPRRDDLCDVGPVHADPSYVRLMTPVRPEQVALEGVHSERSWVGQILLDQSFLTCAVQLRHDDSVSYIIAQIQFSAYPVDGQPFNRGQTVPDQGLHVGPVDEHPHDLVGLHITDVDSLLGVVVVQCHCESEALHNKTIRLTLHREVT